MQTLEPYSYVDDDPANSSDPSGLRGGAHTTPRGICNETHPSNYEGCVQQETTIHEEGPVDDADQALLGQVDQYVRQNYGTVAQGVAGVFCVLTGGVPCGVVARIATVVKLIQESNNGTLGSNWVETVAIGAAEGLSGGTIEGIVGVLGEDVFGEGCDELLPGLANWLPGATLWGLRGSAAASFWILDFLGDSSGNPGSSAPGDLSVSNGDGRCLVPR
jgi:hypothetical protein